MNGRLDNIQSRMTKDPVYNMKVLLERLQTTGTVPEPNKYYVFVYNAKTPNIRYDQHPFVLSGSVFNWGFSGFNQHWGEPRFYTWGELMTPLYPITEDEVEIVNDLPIAYIRNS